MILTCQESVALEGSGRDETRQDIDNEDDISKIKKLILLDLITGHDPCCQTLITCPCSHAKSCLNLNRSQVRCICIGSYYAGLAASQV